MKNDINLTAQNKKQRNALAKITALIVGLFVLVFVVAVLVLFYSFLLKSQVSALSENEASLKAQISSFTIQKESLLLTSERLGSIRKIISTRKDIDEKLTAVLSAIPDGFGVDALTADTDLISIRLSSPSLSDYETLLEERLPQITKDKTSGIRRVDMTSFSITGNEYQLALDFIFTKPKD